jgi:Esterase-like activity of phytase
MTRGWLAGVTAVFLGALVVTLSASNPGVTLIGTGFIPGHALDLSGLAGTPICQRDDHTVCIDQATLGGLGSGVAYTGFNNVFVATPDRGPFDGRTDVPYEDRFHLLHITVDTKATAFPNITTTLLATRFLEDEWRRNFVGDAYAFDTAHPFNTLRFDPEAVAVSPLGNLFVSDEYGPYIREFDRGGHLIRRIRLPKEFRLDPCCFPCSDRGSFRAG